MRAWTSWLLALSCLGGCSPSPVSPDSGALSDLGRGDAGEAIGDAEAPDASIRTRDAGLAQLAPCPLPAPTAWDTAALRAYTRLASGSVMQDRVHYVLTVLEETDTRAALDADAALAALASSANTRMTAAAACAGDAACVRAQLVLPDVERDAAASVTVARLAAAGRLAAVATHLRGSGDHARLEVPDDAAFVRAALDVSLRTLPTALDRALRELDATRIDATVDAELARTPSRTWWMPLSKTAIALLLADLRDEAVRHEDLAAGENAPAVARIPSIDFGAFPYAAIIVPGQSPTDATSALNPVGRARCDLAIARYQAGLAPLILTTGGHVRPDRTQFSEAIEMRRYILTRGVPENAVLVDPYARHTTTNLRNATRLLARYGVPVAKPVMVTSDFGQSAIITSENFAMRCDEELGYQPWQGLVALSTTDTCVTLRRDSLQLDPSDELDP